MRVYLDANPIVYSIEGVPGFRLAALDWMERAEADGALITSRLSRLECRVKPLRDGNNDLLEATATVIESATQFRASYNFRAPDAIHVASASAAKADVFLTGDRSLTRCRELRVEVLTGPGGTA